MAENFDPYHQWLGIPAADQPPSHYRLLGLSMIEDDPDVISAAAEQRMQFVRSFQTGEYADASQTIMNELAAAKVCLLDEDRRRRYDATLCGGREHLTGRTTAADAADVRSAPAVGAPPVAAPPSVPPHPRAAEPVSIIVPSAPSSAAPARRRRTIPLAHLIGGPTLILALIVVVVYLRQRVDSPEQPAPGTPLTELPGVGSDDSLAGKRVLIPDGVVAQDEAGYCLLSADMARIGGQAAKVEDEAIIGWLPGQGVAWELLVSQPGMFMIEVTYAADAAAVGGTAAIEMNGRTVMFYVRDTGGTANFVTDETKMVVIRRGGRYALTMTPGEMPSGELARVKSVRLRPAAIKTHR